MGLPATRGQGHWEALPLHASGQPLLVLPPKVHELWCAPPPSYVARERGSYFGCLVSVYQTRPSRTAVSRYKSVGECLHHT